MRVDACNRNDADVTAAHQETEQDRFGPTLEVVQLECGWAQLNATQLGTADMPAEKPQVMAPDSSSFLCLVHKKHTVNSLHAMLNIMHSHQFATIDTK